MIGLIDDNKSDTGPPAQRPDCLPNMLNISHMLVAIYSSNPIEWSRMIACATFCNISRRLCEFITLFEIK